MFPGVGYPEMIIVGIIALVLYGKELPEVAKKFGKTYGEFRKGMQGFQREFQDVMRDTPARSSVSTPRPAVTPRPEPVESRIEEVRAPRFQPPVAPPKRDVSAN
jgi:sec-independent protein translocase protein TatA